jgi:large subunit ribosomal protein L33
MAKKTYMLLKLVSSAQTGYFYVAKKATRNAAIKMAMVKYDPIVNMNVVFNEQKLKRSKNK